ncbi:UBN2_3 domain-containing protein, partial [Cephalotus follicularis]
LFSAVNNVVVNNQICTIKTLNGDNFKRWKNDVELATGLADLDVALTKNDPAKPATTYQKWERANRLSIMIMKMSISKRFRGVVPSETNAKKFLDAIGQRFLEFEKAKTGELMQKLSTIMNDGESGVRGIL